MIIKIDCSDILNIRFGEVMAFSKIILADHSTIKSEILYCIIFNYILIRLINDLNKLYFKSVVGVIIVYDVSSKASLNEIDYIVKCV